MPVTKKQIKARDSAICKSNKGEKSGAMVGGRHGDETDIGK
jgi:hypothetical protein